VHRAAVNASAALNGANALCIESLAAGCRGDFPAAFKRISSRGPRASSAVTVRSAAEGSRRNWEEYRFVDAGQPR